MDDFGRHLGVLVYGLLWTAGIAITALVLLACLILAGVT